ncbi:MAG: hypothetical protein VX777_06060 [Chlamydiota bacterium]|nr:hypothetical protein [Chlamydiota bacterium]
MTVFTEAYKYKMLEKPSEELERIGRAKPLKAPLKGYTQWSGRAVCLLKSIQTLVREPWRMVKQMTSTVAAIFIAVHELFDGQFKSFSQQILGTMLFYSTIIFRPIAMIKESAQYAIGAIIHPRLAIASPV